MMATPVKKWLLRVAPWFLPVGIVAVWQLASSVGCDAPRDKCAHFREINGIAAAFQYLQKNYIPTALSFL